MFTDRKLKMGADRRSHHVLTLVLDGALYLAPLSKDIKVLLLLIVMQCLADCCRVPLILEQEQVSSGVIKLRTLAWLSWPLIPIHLCRRGPG